MKKILASVYAINPYKGSEDGTGWNLVLQIARFNKVVAITRENNQAHIERYLAQFDVPEAANIQFEYYDLPYWARFWKRGSKGALLYYYLWQLFLPRFIKKKELKFDIAHSLNFHNDWTPSFLWRFDKPFVWGPVGHHPRVPKKFIAPVYGVGKWLADALRWQAKLFFWNIDPFLRVTKNKAARILTINSDVNKQLHTSPGKMHLMPAVATNDMFQQPDRGENFQVISIGRFIALKGFDVTIRAFGEFLSFLTAEEREHCKLVLVGDGPELIFIQKLITSCGLDAHVRIINWIERDSLKSLYGASSIFLFPSHEGAGMVVPEALSCGLPVLCFDNAGPGEFINDDCGIRIPYLTYDASVNQFAVALLGLYRNRPFWEKLSSGARSHFEKNFMWNSKGNTLKLIYEQIS